MSGAQIAAGQVRWFFATGDQAEGWQILSEKSYVAVVEQEEPLDSKTVHAIYQEASAKGRGPAMAALPIDELLR